MKTKILLAASLIAFLAVAFVYGQTALVNAKIPFPFVLAGRTLPAGQYEFVHDVAGGAFRVIEGTKNVGIATVMTRMDAGIHTTPQDSHLVFDKVGDTYTLSEIWVPGQDGYLLWATKGPHEHRMVDVPR